MDKQAKGGRLSKTLKFKLMLFLTLLVIPLVAILYLNNYYSITMADQQMHEYAEKILDNYVLQLDTKMKNVSEYLLKMCLSDAESLNVTDANARYFSRKKLHEELQKVIGFYDVAEGIFVYQQTYNEFARYTQPNLSYAEADQISRYIKENIADILAKDAYTWNSVTFGEVAYFIYTLRVGETYLGAWIPMEAVMTQIRGLDMESLQAIRFVGDAAPVFFEDLSGQAVLDDQGLPVENSKNTFEAASFLDAADLNLSVILEKTSFYQMLSDFQKLIILASIIIVLAVLGSGIIYRRYIFSPMGEIETAIAEVEQGNWEYRIEDQRSSMEFERISHNFNVMASEIRNLKIDVYEEEIHRQQVELEYLHYQIKPHFFLNVINTINSLAQIEETALIQKMTQYLSGYIRYTFRQDHGMVTIKEELETVKNYLGMQLLRFPDSLECEIDIETKAMDALIPAMTILTFVENIIKHAFDMYECTRINIQAQVNDAHQLIITIRDSGKGFTPEALGHIMHNEEITKGGKHVGIVNIKKRLRLIYQDQAEISASNDPGARIDIILPCEGEQKL